MGGVEDSRVGGGLHADVVWGNTQPIGLVFVFAHAEVICLDEFDVMLASDGTAGEVHHLAADLVQVAAPHRDDLADFSI